MFAKVKAQNLSGIVIRIDFSIAFNISHSNLSSISSSYTTFIECPQLRCHSVKYMQKTAENKPKFCLIVLMPRSIMEPGNRLADFFVSLNFLLEVVKVRHPEHNKLKSKTRIQMETLL